MWFLSESNIFLNHTEKNIYVTFSLTGPYCWSLHVQLPLTHGTWLPPTQSVAIRVMHVWGDEVSLQSQWECQWQCVSVQRNVKNLSQKRKKCCHKFSQRNIHYTYFVELWCFISPHNITYRSTKNPMLIHEVLKHDTMSNAWCATSATRITGPKLLVRPLLLYDML